MLTFETWLERTLELQRGSFGTDPPSLRGEDRAEYLRWNVLAAMVELGEFLDETQWKPWATGEGRINDRDAAVEEVVDVMHFIGNILCVLDVSGEELTRVYEGKIRVNAGRQAAGNYVG